MTDFSNLFPPRPLQVRPAAEPAAARHEDCGERFRLRAEYIERLAEFNAAAARQRMAQRAGMRGPGAESAWRSFQAACAASNAAWARYRAHVAAHGCKHGARSEMAPAA